MRRARHSARSTNRPKRDVTWGYSTLTENITLGAGQFTGIWLVGSANGIGAANFDNFRGDETVIRMLPHVGCSSVVSSTDSDNAGTYFGIIDWDQAGSVASIPAITPDPRDGAWDWMWRWAVMWNNEAGSSQLVFYDSTLANGPYADVRSMRKMGKNKGLLMVANNYANNNVALIWDVRFAVKLPW